MNGKTISRQRQWQLRKKSQGLCIICGKTPRFKRDGSFGTLCQTHREYQNRWRKRKKKGEL